jgi:hypothetical protein
MVEEYCPVDDDTIFENITIRFFPKFGIIAVGRL